LARCSIRAWVRTAVVAVFLRNSEELFDVQVPVFQIGAPAPCACPALALTGNGGVVDQLSRKGNTPWEFAVWCPLMWSPVHARLVQGRCRSARQRIVGQHGGCHGIAW